MARSKRNPKVTPKDTDGGNVSADRQAKVNKKKAKNPQPTTTKPSLSKNIVRIVNQHTARIILPRVPDTSKKIVESIKIDPGNVCEIRKPDWAVIENNQVVQAYLERGLLAVVTRKQDFIPTLAQTVNTEDNVPAHLKDGGEITGASGVKVKTSITGLGSVDIPQG